MVDGLQVSEAMDQGPKSAALAGEEAATEEAEREEGGGAREESVCAHVRLLNLDA